MRSSRISGYSVLVFVSAVTFDISSPSVLRAQDLTPGNQTWSHAVHDSAGILYRPVAEHFRPRYEEDEANKSRQSWEQYWRWVRTFYSGNWLSRGWIEECEMILGRIPETEQRNNLTVRMNILGRIVAAEWAKDNSVRRISTGDVRRWRSWLREAAGSGTEIRIRAVMDVIQRIEEAVRESLFHTSWR